MCSRRWADGAQAPGDSTGRSGSLARAAKAVVDPPAKMEKDVTSTGGMEADRETSTDVMSTEGMDADRETSRDVRSAGGMDTDCETSADGGASTSDGGASGAEERVGRLRLQKRCWLSASGTGSVLGKRCRFRSMGSSSTGLSLGPG